MQQTHIHTDINVITHANTVWNTKHNETECEWLAVTIWQHNSENAFTPAKVQVYAVQCAYSDMACFENCRNVSI